MVWIETTKKGYVCICLCDGREKRRVRIHRLIAVAEYGFDAVDGKLVHHKNEIPWDNRPCNLEPMGWSEHAKHHKPIESRWGGRDDNGLTIAERELLSIYANEGGWLSSGDVVNHPDNSRSSGWTQTALPDLQERGFLERRGDGEGLSNNPYRYRITERGKRSLG